LYKSCVLCPRAYLWVPDHGDPHLLPCCGYLLWRSTGLNTDKDPGRDPHWQDVKSPASWLHLRPVPYKRDPHDKSLPRTTSLCLARQVSASHDLPPAPTGVWAMARCASTTTDTHGGTIPHAMQIQQLASMQVAGPDKGLNAGLIGCVTIPSPSLLTLLHASSARGTQAPPTTSSSLDLGSSVAG
jgi:hypothetical protein